MREGMAVPDPADDRSGDAVISEGYLAMAGVPVHYPGYDELGQDMDEAMLEACDDVLEGAKTNDPLLAAMLDPDWREWDVVSLPWGQLRAGMRLPNGAAVCSINEHWISLDFSNVDAPFGVRRTSIPRDVGEVTVVVPIPFDGTAVYKRHA